MSKDYGLDVDPQRHVHSLTVGERQRVEIVRCLLQNPRLLIMDEPTSVLTPQAVQKLFTVLRRLASEGCSILYISHKLDEIQALCENATVMRGGRVTGNVDPRKETHASLAQLMVGHSLPDYTRREHTPGDARLAVKNLSVASPDPFGTSLDERLVRGASGRNLRHRGRVGQRPGRIARGALGRNPRPARRRRCRLDLRQARRAPDARAAPPARLRVRAGGAARTRRGAGDVARR